MASGVVQNFLTPYRSGDSFTIPSGKGSYTGFLANPTTARIVIPISKPAESGLVANISGIFVIRAFNDSGGFSNTEITVNATANIYATGIAFDITGATFGVKDSVCSVGSRGITVTFTSAS